MMSSAVAVGTTSNLVRAMGREIRRIRVMHDISIAQISDATGVSVWTIQRLERGTQNTRLDGALRVVMYLRDTTNITLDELVPRAVPASAGKGAADAPDR